jgi:2,5-diamino-6-(ribosylamino)-4(3H)-pyrimidinone 5'-phosphate reductase
MLDGRRVGGGGAQDVARVSGRPYVLINVAASADGKIDTVERRGAAVSSAADRARVDRLRAEVDAVMVGGRTLRQEDPRLTVRSADLRAERTARGQPENPAKVAVTTTLPFSSRPSAARFLTHGPARVIVFVPDSVPTEARRAVEGLGAQVFACGTSRVDLEAALRILHELGIRRLLVEGGATLNFELLRLQLVDEIQVFVAPVIFGGATAPTLADGPGLPRQSALELRRIGVEEWPDGGVLLRYAVVRGTTSPEP